MPQFDHAQISDSGSAYREWTSVDICVLVEMAGRPSGLTVLGYITFVPTLLTEVDVWPRFCCASGWHDWRRISLRISLGITDRPCPALYFYQWGIWSPFRLVWCDNSTVTHKAISLILFIHLSNMYCSFTCLKSITSILPKLLAYIVVQNTVLSAKNCRDLIVFHAFRISLISIHHGTECVYSLPSRYENL